MSLNSNPSRSNWWPVLSPSVLHAHGAQTYIWVAQTYTSNKTVWPMSAWGCRWAHVWKRKGNFQALVLPPTMGSGDWAQDVRFVQHTPLLAEPSRQPETKDFYNKNKRLMFPIVFWFCLYRMLTLMKASNFPVTHITNLMVVSFFKYILFSLTKLSVFI